MTVPPFDAFMLPMLRMCEDQKVRPMHDVIARLSDDFSLTPQDREQLLPSGSTTVVRSRIGWAKTYLKQAGLLEQPRRAHVRITVRGLQLLSRHPPTIDVRLLEEFDDFQAFQRRTKASAHLQPQSNPALQLGQALDIAAAKTPEEQIEEASSALDTTIRDALLARVLEASPTFFEKLIIDLLLSMGYGGSRADAGEHVGGTGDGGIDGLIREDQLGLSRVYLQAKRYQLSNSVGSDAVHAFMGALVSKGAQKGVFITTSSFTKAAAQIAEQPGHLRLVLINGEELTSLMLRFGVGVRMSRTIEIKRVDLDYFDDSEPE